MHEKGLILFALNKIECNVGQFIRKIVTLFCRQRFVIRFAKRVIIGRHPASDGFVKPEGLGISAHMRLSVIGCSVTVFLQRLCQRLLIKGKTTDSLATMQLFVVPFRAPPAPVGQIGTRRILSS